MSQHDMNIANQGFPNTRSDLNLALVALVSNSSGATAPSTMYSYQWWLDTNTTPTTLKMRNTANDAWISVMFLNQSTNVMSLSLASPLTVSAGTAALPAIISTTGTADTGFWFPAADTIAASTGGTERIRISSGGNVGIACTPTRRLSVQYDFAKTDTSSRAIAVFKSNDASNANEMLISSTGAATQASRVWNVQTGEDGVANAGIVSLQADGGNVTVGRATVVDSARLSLYGGSLAGLGLATSQVVNYFNMSIDSQGGLTTRKDGADFWYAGRGGSANCVNSGGNWVDASDERLKENIVTLPDALNKVCSLRGVSFNRISSGKPEIGLIAQEVQQVYPDVVEVGDYLGLHYGALVGALVEAIKDLKTITETQAARITALENK